MSSPQSPSDARPNRRDGGCSGAFAWVIAGLCLLAAVGLGVALAARSGDASDEESRLKSEIASLRAQLTGAEQRFDALTNNATALRLLLTNATADLEATAQQLDQRTCKAPAPDVTFPERVAEVFDPFTGAELELLANFVRANLSLAEEEPEDMLGDWLYAIDFEPHNKASALAYLDGTAATYAGRYARAIVYHLADPTNAKVVEYKVGPLPLNSLDLSGATVVPIQQGGTLQGTDIPAVMRPVSDAEYDRMEPIISAGCAELDDLFQESYGEKYEDGDGRFTWTDSAPRGFTKNTRQTWIWFLWLAEGKYALPIGLQFLIDHMSMNASDWSIIQVVYNGQGPWNTTAELAGAFPTLTHKINYTWPEHSDAAPLWSSLRRRGAVRALDNRPIPELVTFEGQRYAVEGRQIHWMGWDMHLGFSIISGVYFNDLRFLGERVIYELSLQDAYASYSGAQPLQSLSMYSDAGWAMGTSGFTLVRGVDCPAHATYIDNDYFFGGEVGSLGHGVCVWEQPENIAIMRHYDISENDNHTYAFVGAYPRTVLVVRTTATVYNYDYYYSYIFYAEGSVHVSVMATGYLQSDFYPTSPEMQEKEKPFSVRVGPQSIGSLHDHLFGFKVDLDVLGHKNSAMRADYRVGDFSVPWNFDGALTRFKYVQRTDLDVETMENGTYRASGEQPAMFMFMNHHAPNDGKNAWGVERAYMVHVKGTALQLMKDEDAPWMVSQQWTRHTVAITRQHDDEPRSCRPLYDMQAPADTLLKFDSFIDGESMHQEDLVAWVTVGAMHLPSAEDAPITTTPGTETGFYIRPFNYFDESAATSINQYFFRRANEEIMDGFKNLNEDPVVPVNQRCFDPVAPPEFPASS